MFCSTFLDNYVNVNVNVLSGKTKNFPTFSNYLVYTYGNRYVNHSIRKSILKKENKNLEFSGEYVYVNVFVEETYSET